MKKLSNFWKHATALLASLLLAVIMLYGLPLVHAQRLVDEPGDVDLYEFTEVNNEASPINVNEALDAFACIGLQENLSCQSFFTIIYAAPDEVDWNGGDSHSGIVAKIVAWSCKDGVHEVTDRLIFCERLQRQLEFLQGSSILYADEALIENFTYECIVQFARCIPGCPGGILQQRSSRWGCFMTFHRTDPNENDTRIYRCTSERWITDEICGTCSSFLSSFASTKPGCGRESSRP